MKKFIVNFCDVSGNIETGYEEILEGTREEVETDFRRFHEDFETPVDIEPVEQHP